MTDSTDSTLSAALVAALADGRPHAFDELLDGLAGQLPDDEHEALHALADALDQPRFATLDDEYWLDIIAMCDGRVFTHVLSADEIAAGIVAIQPDLDLPLLPFATTVPFAGGDDGTIVFDDEDADLSDALAVAVAAGGLRGPDGWLANHHAGDTVAFGLRDGRVRLHTATAGDGDGTVAALATAYRELVGEHDACTDLIALQIQLLVDVPAALSDPLPPIGDLVAGAGLEIRGDWVGPAGGTWMTPPERMAAERDAFNAEVFGFSDCCREALRLSEAAFQGFDEEATPDAIVEALAHGQVAEAFAAGYLSRGADPEEARDLIGFVDHLLKECRRANLAGVHYLEAVVCDSVGRTVEAEEAARAALRDDPERASAHEIIAEYLDVRGDATGALRHLIRAGATEDDQHVARLAIIAAAAENTKVGRNDPCPCGSGKKFKVCCIDDPQLPEDVRFAWLYAKASVYAMGAARRGAVTHLASHTVHAAGAGESASERASQDVRLADLAIFEDGLLEDFLAERGALLPAAEADAAEDWLDVPIGVYEVAAAEDGRLELADAITGARSWVIYPRSFEVGHTLVARLLPFGDGVRLGGPLIDVPDGFRESAVALAADPDAAGCDWAEWLGRTESDDPDAANRPHGHAHGEHHHHHH